MKNAGVVTITAGVLFGLAMAGQAVAPYKHPQKQPPFDKVVVGGKETAPKPWTKEQQRGREVYVREGCASCHTQLIRTVEGDDLRWGPASQAGEYAADPHPLIGRRRIGPDLARIGGKVDDAWHLAHLYDPRLISPDSVMPAYPWLFRVVRIPVNAVGDEVQFGLVPDAASALFEKKGEEKAVVTADEFGRAFLKDADGRPATKAAGKPELKIAGDPKRFTVKEVAVIAPTEDALALVAYLQRLGTDLGEWQEEFRAVRGGTAGPVSAASLLLGAEVYARRCQGCHGAHGDGRGPAAAFLPLRPRDFEVFDAEMGQQIRPSFKFTSTKAGQLPTDTDLYRTVTHGLRGTSMPSFAGLPEAHRWAVVQYVKSFSPWFAEFQMRTGKDWQKEPQPPAEPISPDPFAEDGEEGVKKAIALGEEVYHGLATCWTCHRAYATQDQVKDFLTKFQKPPTWREGADQKAEAKEDKFGGLVMPPDFGRDPMKMGASLEDLYRVIGMGVAGTAMPTWKGQLEEEQLWGLAYYTRSLIDRGEKK